MGLNLTRTQWEEILTQLDVSQTGIIEYKEIVQLGAEIIHGIFSKNQAQKDLREKEEESRFQANLMLYIDDIHELYNKIIEECRKLDEEDNYYITFEQFKGTLEAQGEILNTQEREQILLNIQAKYNDKIKYEELKEVFKDYIWNQLVNGLILGYKSKLENYLLETFEAYDQQKNGTILIADLITALRISDKILLSKVQVRNCKINKCQLYIVQSFLKQDENGFIDYRIQSRQLAQMIKKFFNIDLQETKKTSLFCYKMLSLIKIKISSLQHWMRLRNYQRKQGIDLIKYIYKSKQHIKIVIKNEFCP